MHRFGGLRFRVRPAVFAINSAIDIVPAIVHTTATSTPTIAIARQCITMGKKKNKFEVSDNGVKKEVRPNRVPLGVDMARLMHGNWLPCGKPATGGTCTCRRGDQEEVS
ncbi:hypothetical protein QYE76_063359 [Lolium multiflorum]|uniref:Uncharacterized protein n=1 Tax=Lolium multiflorum TaxID=4521 RepID=A0AAD8S4S5_LOLMU|nr:hypothetical protein QYE76_063359 [Lolium multiflorum]